MDTIKDMHRFPLAVQDMDVGYDRKVLHWLSFARTLENIYLL